MDVILAITLGFVYSFLGMLFYSGDLNTKLSFKKFIKIIVAFTLWPIMFVVLWGLGINPKDMKDIS